MQDKFIKSKHRPLSVGLIIAAFWIALFSHCQREPVDVSANLKLSFSTDTVTFDTVFTGIGTTTRHFKVYNQNSVGLEISEIRLGGKSDNFRLNIDGIASNSAKNMKIRAKDSLYIFVEATIDPDRDAMLEHDSVIFKTNGNWQDVDLVAFGQDVHLINGNDSSGIIATATWDNEKPYLIYNSMLVDSGAVLNITEGTKLHFHNGSRMYVLGTLIAQGALDQPVVFTSDRLDEWYENLPGQWDGIWLLSGSKNNYLEYVEIKNAIIGLQVDTFANEYPTVQLHNSRIENMSAIGLLAQGAKVFATNTLFANCGQIAVALTIGGAYQFHHCTIGNLWVHGQRNTPAVLLNNYYKDVNGNYHIRPLHEAYFGNCIIHGNNENELILDSFPGVGSFMYQFEYCLIRQKEPNTADTRFENILWNPEFRFKNVADYDYSLDTLSVAKDAGSKSIVRRHINLLEMDMAGQNRLQDLAPDLGIFERIE